MFFSEYAIRWSTCIQEQLKLKYLYGLLTKLSVVCREPLEMLYLVVSKIQRTKSIIPRNSSRVPEML
jgi:hypothetical protein